MSKREFFLVPSDFVFTGFTVFNFPLYIKNDNGYNIHFKFISVLESYQGQREIEIIQERYLTALRVFVENRFPQQSGRLSDLLSRLPEIQSAGELMLHTKMFFVPLLLNTTYAR